MKIIKQLEEFSPRLFENQELAADYLRSLLDGQGLPYRVEQFKTKVPEVKTIRLEADGKPIECLSTSLVSGEIKGEFVTVDSSVDYSESELPNINYNGKSDVVSRASHYPCPSFAISRKDVKRIKEARTVIGQVEIEPRDWISENILAGNITYPKNIIFTHFDSLENGAMDNASGTAVCMTALLNNTELLTDNLFVFSSDEELSCEIPVYWGVGYRNFEKRHPLLLQKAEKIFVVDGLGLTKPAIHQEAIDEYFPIRNIEKYKKKIKALSCSEESQWLVYHSKEDTLEKLKESYIREGVDLLVKVLS